MAEPLKRLLGPDVVSEIATQLGRTGAVDEGGFRSDALDGLDQLELMQRSAHIAQAFADHLPRDYATALDTLRATLHPDTEAALADMTLDGQGLRGWAVAPMGNFVMENGLDRPQESLAFLADMTSRFSAEFAVRPFLRDRTIETLAYAQKWAADPNPHRRRLTSEGTRPRLPWGIRLKTFVDDPAPLIPILTQLRDDPSDYVRRSVANNLNDIAKDHPDLVAALTHDWMQDAPPQRQKLLKHACRSLIKAGHPATLANFGYTPPDDLTASVTVSPTRLRLGETLTVDLDLTSPTDCDLLIDLVLHFRKADGRLAPKVFKWTETAIVAGTPLLLTKALPLRPVTTRRHYPGAQALEVQVNGKAVARTEFDLQTD